MPMYKGNPPSGYDTGQPPPTPPTPPPTLGQSRVRLSFNPSANPNVENIKMRAADLIDLCEDFKVKGVMADSGPDSEKNRLLSLAQTHFEDAAMWAVKGVTG